MGDRIEHDSLGEVRVPADARWGPQTQRAVENFPVSGVRLERRLIRALALIKAEAALVNGRLEEVPQVDADMARAIHESALEVAIGAHHEDFPIDVFQTGSGTSSNMNANEVIASLAAERLGRPVHPNDHVNASQSSNDVFPTAIRLAAGEAVTRDVLPALEHLRNALARKGLEFADIVKSGRTHLMDAVPVTLGQEFDAYTDQVDEAVERFRQTLPRVLTVPLGGTAVGTGLNCPDGFAPAVIEALADRTGLGLRAAPNRMARQAAADALVELSGQTRTAAVALHKIVNDLRWMGSGPGAGLSEIALPELQPGSSIMPGKVNPVIPEAVAQVAAQIIGDDAAVAFAGAQGAFELNTYLPVISRNVLEPLRLLANVARLLADRCVAGITADVETCARHATSSPAIATALAPRLGYEVTAKVVQRAIRERRPIRDVVVEEGLLDAAEADRLLDVMALTRGGLQ